MIDLPPEAGKALPSALGAFSAAIIAIVQDPSKWRIALALVLPGIALSFYASAHLAKTMDIPEGLAGYMLGLLGMAAAAKILGTWQQFDLGGILSSWLRKILGLEKQA